MTNRLYRPPSRPSRRPRWRRFWRAALLAALLLASCAPAAIPSGGGLTVTAPAGEVARALQGAAAAYARAGGEPVNVVAFSTDSYSDQTATALLAGLDRYDLMYLPADTLAKWVQYKALQPLAPAPDRAALGPWLDALTVGGQAYGYPTQPDPLVLWLRTDLFAAAGLQPPPDWPGVRAAAQALHNPPTVYGIAIAGSDIDAGFAFSAVLAGFGGQAVSFQAGGLQVQLDTPAARDALAFYSALRAGGLTPPGAAEATQAGVIQALASGQAAMGIASLSAAVTLRDCQASPKACAAGRALLSAVWLPGLDERTALGSLGAWVVPLHARESAAAQRFGAWLSSPEGAAAWSASGGIPAQAGGPLPEGIAEAAKGLPLGQVQQFRSPFPPVATADLLVVALNEAVHDAVSGAKTPADALANAAARFKQSLRQAGARVE